MLWATKEKLRTSKLQFGKQDINILKRAVGAGDKFFVNHVINHSIKNLDNRED